MLYLLIVLLYESSAGYGQSIRRYYLSRLSHWQCFKMQICRLYVFRLPAVSTIPTITKQLCDSTINRYVQERRIKDKYSDASSRM